MVKKTFTFELCGKSYRLMPEPTVTYCRLLKFCTECFIMAKEGPPQHFLLVYIVCVVYNVAKVGSM